MTRFGTRTGSVQRTADLDRILALPRQGAIEPADLTSVLALKSGGQQLWPAQNRSLHALDSRNYFGAMAVGSGKTLITLLVAHILDLDPARVVLIVPDSLKDRTRNDAIELRKHWPVRLPYLLGYKELGFPSGYGTLEKLKPLCIIADEAHRLKNPGAAVTQRVTRYMDAHPETIFVPLTGTPWSRYEGCHHLAKWAMGVRSPIPLVQNTAQAWDRALQPNIQGVRLGHGVLSSFGKDPPKDYRRWILDTPGIVSAPESGCPASIVVTKWAPELPAKLREMISLVEQTAMRPDGEPLDPAESAACVSQLALGCWYAWDPLPPLEWLDARRRWVRFWQQVLAADPTLDTPALVARAYPDRWEQWMAVKKTFRPNPVVHWVDDTPLRKAVEWARSGSGPGIVWTRWRAVGERLEKLGLPYFRDLALDGRGRHIESVHEPIAASLSSCGTGTRLHRFQRSLLLTPPSEMDIWEQWAGRMHRPGQEADEVFLDLYCVIDYHREVLRRARAEAKADPEPKKLALATWA